MADKKISELTAIDALADLDEFPANDVSVADNRKVTGSQLLAYVNASFGTNVATFLVTPSSTNLISAVTDETGSGKLVFATSPTLVTPVLGTPTSGTLTNCTGYTDANLSTTDVTTNNSTSAKHGFVPKLSGNTYDFFGGDGSFRPSPGIMLYAKSVSNLTSGAPADLTSIAVPSGITRFRMVGGTGPNTFNCIVTESQTGNPAAGTIELRDTAGGGGTQILTATGPPNSATPLSTGWVPTSNTVLSTASTIYIRQTVNAAFSAVLSFYILIEPLP
jgi:hypothetical protein